MKAQSLFQTVAGGIRLLGTAALLAALAGFAAPAPPARAAASFTVDSTVDAPDFIPGNGVCATRSGACTLRAAIQEANALPGADLIALPTGTYTLARVGTGEDAAASGDLDITEDLTIKGAGAARTIVDGNGAAVRDRVFHILAPANVKISGITILGGQVQGGGGFLNRGTLTLAGVVVRKNTSEASPAANTGNGGGIFNAFDGTLTLAKSIIEDNVAGGNGGGIVNFGAMIMTSSIVRANSSAGDAGGIDNTGDPAKMELTNSTIHGNTADGLGGGIRNGGSLILTASTISANAANQGGGLFNAVGKRLALTNATISANLAGRDGGGILNFGDVELNNVTIAHNIADNDGDGLGTGGGVFNDTNGTVTVKNSILGVNNRGGAAPDDCSGVLTLGGFNLVQVRGTICTFTGDLTGIIAGVDPKFGPLQDNGGPTATHALLAGSPALDIGNPAAPGSGGAACAAVDQRGVVRPRDGDGDGAARCDAGAFEL